MAKSLKSLSLLFVLLLLSSALFMSDARPLVDEKPGNSAINREFESFFDGLDLKGNKTGGDPSPVGDGHGIKNARNLQVVKNSGPGPGEGH
ncbi:hypothetical protein I3843_15G045300 [Carya illinoinensis]|uniref:Transmembrane protein n=1 Tax=Carya illinoinensis TaxID=32201 RepID=A0A8T1N4D6_CARIL|nr:hypothetical protein I3760_15G048800 [Carya illinoinensis]KAG6626466.1 hypothetical protein CIPAW_15G050500 [Carya illinoinensis]KAG6674573.1 hypothetical protein I3842_15G049700 [Carya illinoinensis]KAG7943534.1 hypothetical protein I3843_15G045300 [Carya illinoinensis]